MDIYNQLLFDNLVKRRLCSIIRDWSISQGNGDEFVAEILPELASWCEGIFLSEEGKHFLVKQAFRSGLCLHKNGDAVNRGAIFDRAVIDLFQSSLKFAGLKVKVHGAGTTSALLMAITGVFKRGGTSSAEVLFVKKLEDVYALYVGGELGISETAHEIIDQAKKHLCWAFLIAHPVKSLIHRRAETLGFAVQPHLSGHDGQLAVVLSNWLRKVCENYSIMPVISPDVGMSDDYAF